MRTQKALKRSLLVVAAVVASVVVVAFSVRARGKSGETTGSQKDDQRRDDVATRSVPDDDNVYVPQDEPLGVQEDVTEERAVVIAPWYERTAFIVAASVTGAVAAITGASLCIWSCCTGRCRLEPQSRHGIWVRGKALPGKLPRLEKKVG